MLSFTHRLGSAHRDDGGLDGRDRRRRPRSWARPFPNGSAATGWFRYGDVRPGTCDDTFGTRAPDMNGFDLGAGAMSKSFEQPLTDLKPKFTYFYCAAASNDAGAAFGDVLSFTTEAVPPVVKTEDAPTNDQGDAMLTGTVNPMGSDAIAWFRYDGTDPASATTRSARGSRRWTART